MSEPVNFYGEIRNLNLKAANGVVINSGTASLTQCYTKIYSESGLIDNLDCISFNYIAPTEGDLIYITTGSGNYDITVRHNQGNIKTNDSRSKSLNQNTVMQFMFNGSNFNVLNLDYGTGLAQVYSTDIRNGSSRIIYFSGGTSGNIKQTIEFVSAGTADTIFSYYSGGTAGNVKQTISYLNGVAFETENFLYTLGGTSGNLITTNIS